MKKLYLYLLLMILFLGLVKALAEIEYNIEATVTVNPFPGALNVSPEYLYINAPLLSFVEKELTFQQDGNTDLNVVLHSENAGDWLSFSANEFILKPADNRSIKVYINISEIEPVNYSTNIHAAVKDQDLIIPVKDLIIPVNITVTDKYKLSVNIDVSPHKISPGENISVLTRLTRSNLKQTDADVEGKIAVNLEYNILMRKKLITNLTTTMDVIDSNIKTIPILIPADALRGSYTVEVIAIHLNKTDKDQDHFLVKTKLWTRFFNFFTWFRY